MNSSAAAGQGMLCPVCKVTLSISDRQGVEIDFCPQCRGVWLDLGELDKIIERSEAVMPIQSRGVSHTPRGRSRHYDGDSYGSRHHRRKPQRGFLTAWFV